MQPAARVGQEDPRFSGVEAFDGPSNEKMEEIDDVEIVDQRVSQFNERLNQPVLTGGWHAGSLSVACSSPPDDARNLAAMEGSFRFEPESGGARLSYRMRMVPVKPKAARIERMVSREIDTAFSRDLRRHIERSVLRADQVAHSTWA